jgi:ATP synthase protein I
VRSVLAKMESGFIRRLASFTMNDESPNKPERKQPPLQSEVGSKAARKLKARRNAHAGRLVRPGHDGAYRLVGGDSDAARRGAWPLAGQRHPGSHSWTLALLVAGLAIGCLNAWHWVAKEDKAMRDEQEDDDE